MKVQFGSYFQLKNLMLVAAKTPRDLMNPLNFKEKAPEEYASIIAAFNQQLTKLVRKEGGVVVNKLEDRQYLAGNVTVLTSDNASPESDKKIKDFLEKHAGRFSKHLYAEKTQSIEVNGDSIGLIFYPLEEQLTRETENLKSNLYGWDTLGKKFEKAWRKINQK